MANWWDDFPEVTAPESQGEQWFEQYDSADVAVKPGIGAMASPAVIAPKRVPFADRLSAAAGAPVLTESDLSPFERMDLGLSDTFDERLTKFQRQGKGELRQVPFEGGQREIYRRSPQEPWRMVDTLGFDWKDLLDRPQDIPTIAGQAATAALMPASLPLQLGMQAAIPGLMHLGKEGIETARGFQQQPMSSVLGTAAGESAMDLALGAIPAGVAGLMRGPKAHLSQTIVGDFNKIRELQSLEPGVIDPMVHQIRPDSLILGRLAAQASSTSPAMKGALTEQQMTFGDLVMRNLDATIDRTGEVLITEGRKAMDRGRREVMRDFKVNNEEAGAAIKGIFDGRAADGFAKKSRAQINAAYDEAGKLAQGVHFDLTGAQSAAREVTAPVNAVATTPGPGGDNVVDLFTGRTITGKDVQQFVNVAGSRGEKVNRVARLLSQIDPEQLNWEVVKELRSQVGDVIAQSPAAEDATSGAAKRIYSELTRSMENPINASDGFVSAWQKANSLARKRFEVYEQGRVLRVLAEDSPSAVAKQFINDPDQLTPVIRGVIDDYAPQKKETIRKGIQSGILEQPNATQAIENWKMTGKGNENAYNWLFKNQAEREAFSQAAQSMDELKALPIQKIVDGSTARIDAGKKLLANVGPTELNRVVKAYGGSNSPAVEAMRLSAIDEIIQKNLKFSQDGIQTVDPKGLQATIQDMRRRGIWEGLLTKEDQVRLKGMEAYVRRTQKSLMDTGTSLEQAQAIAALKHPSTFLQGVHALAVNNRILAPLLMSKRTSKLFTPRTRRRGPARKDAWFVFLGQLSEDVARLSAEMSVDERQQP